MTHEKPSHMQAHVFSLSSLSLSLAPTPLSLHKLADTHPDWDITMSKPMSPFANWIHTHVSVGQDG